MSRPLALDLFCGAGGAAMGLYRAGFDVIGIDIKRQPRYPFPFILADALKPPVRLEDFDLIWASPPCQGYSIMRNLPWNRDREYPLLIGPVRDLLRESGVHYAIENVDGARRHMEAGWLCGTMFDLPIYRHRRFETSFYWMAPAHGAHRDVIRPGRFLGERARAHRKLGGVHKAKGETRGMVEEAFGIDWMSRNEIQQAIPPAYSEHIGRYALMALGREVE